VKPFTDAFRNMKRLLEAFNGFWKFPDALESFLKLLIAIAHTDKRN